MFRDLFLTAAAAAQMRAEIQRARGNEVCFLCRVGETGEVEEPRVVARGHRSAVLAAVRDAAAGELVVHNHPSGELEPSDPDLALAAELYERGAGLAITDNLARELYVVVAPAEARAVRALDEAEVEAALAPGGAVSRSHPAYEDRPTQRELALGVAAVYNRGGILLAEAGTGTGKSIAYLIPAVRWAALNRERTVVSTNTINLQEQLVTKDLPFLRSALGEPFRFALVKGRGNYISIRRAQLAAQGQTLLFDGGQRSELGAILEWLRTTREGSLQDLPFTPTPAVWDEVASETDVCLRARCPHFEQCFYQRARRDAASADVLVVNHHLLFSDLAVRRAQGNYTAPAVLPPYRRVILDEAHNLEESATSHLGAAVSRRGLFRLLGRLERRGRGLLRIIEERLKAGRDDLLQQDALREISGTVRPALERVRQRAAEFFRGLDTLVAAAPEGVLRLDAEFLTQPLWAESLSLIYEGLALSLEELARGLERLRETILLDTAWSDALQGELVELQGAAGRTRAALDALRLAFAPAQDAFPLVRWLERRGGREAGAAGAGGDGGEGGERGEGNVAVRTAPVDISEPLRESLFEQVDTAVLTSATLATRGDFGFLKSRLGLARGGLRLREAVYPSPFEFERQTLIAIPTDVPAPVGEEGAFDYATAEIVADVADTSDGGIFGLFTSYRSLRAVAGELRRRGLHARWPLFEQGEAPRAQLIEAFTRCGRGVLLGVASFWEGVDVPGHPLRGLVIAKLPFKVPAEPVTAARIEAIEQEGGDSFREYVLPHAALRLKQGFGRLIRSGSDRGAVVLLDRRVVEKGYGRYFFETLPPAPVHTGPWSELRAVVRQFYGNAPG